MFLGSFHQAIGPSIAVVAVLLLGLMSRYIFGNGHGPSATPAPVVAEFGLLAPVATTSSAAGARELTVLLARQGVRATIGADDFGRAQVLVFPGDLERARQAVNG